MRTRCRIAAVHLALVAMLLRALVPAGWMPNPGEAGGSPFVICSVQGPAHPAAPSHAPDHNRPGAPCVFAAAAPLAPPLLAALVPGAAYLSTPVRFVAARDAIVRDALYRPNAARAPPAFA